jgi:hypothetical protein
MIFYKKEKVEQELFHAFICDKCGNEIIGEVELQETFSINFIGGYSSVFGDGNEISCDLCQDCLQELIGSFCKYNGEGRKKLISDYNKNK